MDYFEKCVNDFSCRYAECFVKDMVSKVKNAIDLVSPEISETSLVPTVPEIPETSQNQAFAKPSTALVLRDNSQNQTSCETSLVPIVPVQPETSQLVPIVPPFPSMCTTLVPFVFPSP